MAESVDALVSNTSGATHPGSIPGLGTETEKVFQLSPFSFWRKRAQSTRPLLSHPGKIMGEGPKKASIFFGGS